MSRTNAFLGATARTRPRPSSDPKRKFESTDDKTPRDQLLKQARVAVTLPSPHVARERGDASELPASPPSLRVSAEPDPLVSGSDLGSESSRAAAPAPAPNDRLDGRPDKRARPVPPIVDHRDKFYFTFKSRSVIGKGSFGFVQQGTWSTFSLQFMTAREFLGEAAAPAPAAPSREVAIKSMPKYGVDGKNCMRYITTEVEVMLRLRECPFIVPLIAVIQERYQIHVVLQYCPGGDLFSFLARARHNGEMTSPSPAFTAQMMFWLCEVVVAVEHMHAHNILHGDLKCENLLIDRDGHVCFCDFGLSRVGVTGEIRTEFCGSEFTVSPEQLRSEPYGVATDIWALGYILLMMFTDLIPIRQLWTDLDNGNIEALETQTHLDPRMKSLITRVLTVDKTRRPTITQILDDDLFRGVDWDAVYNKTATQPRAVGAPAVDVDASTAGAAGAAGVDAVPASSVDHTNFENDFTALTPRPIEYEECKMFMIL